MKEFYPLRLKLYGDRKDFLTGMLTAEALRLSNQARFILEKIGGKISIGKLARARRRKYRKLRFAYYN